MNRNSFTFKALALVVFALATTALAQAQASRTWVSGVGDDANPCSRTAPCKTWPGAISKTATNGEIDALDPGGFGTVTITKSITLDGGGTLASILSAGTNGVNVNAAGANVTLRRISINGFGTGLHGVSATAVGVLNVEDCYIFGHLNEGILVNIASNANVNVKRSTIVGNGLSGTAGAGAGIRATTSSGNVFLTAVNTSCDNNNEGFRMENNVHATVSNSTASNNALNGFDVFPSAGASDMNVESSVSANNKQWGVVTGANGTIRLSNTTVTDNAVQGLNPIGGSILSYSNNKVQGNGAGGANNGSPTGPAPQT
jgi:hypothetical protein